MSYQIKKLKNLSDYFETFIYKVEENQSLNEISNRFHTTVNCIVSMNNLSSDLRQNQMLIIKKVIGDRYVVKPKDTILSLSHNDNNIAQKILIKNMIDYIYVGQIIYI